MNTWPGPLARKPAVEAVLGRQRTETALHESELILQGLLQNSQEGIVLTEETGRIIVWNPAQERISGIPKSQALGEYIYDAVYRSLPPEIKSSEVYPRFKQMLATHLSGEWSALADQVFEHELMRPDGSRVVVRNSYFAIRTERGWMAGCICRDVTRSRRAEQAEREMLRVKQEFIDSVSHSLRNPIRNLLGFLEKLQAGAVGNPGVQDRSTARAIADTRQLAALVDDLVDTSDLEAGGLVMKLYDIDIQRVIDEAIASLQPQVRDRGIPLVYAPAHEGRSIRGSPPRLQQVVVNLLENAIRVSQAGSPVLVTSHAEDSELMVQVIDQGPGIPSELEQAVFEQHHAADQGASQPAGGTGLELYSSKRIIEAHGGRIGVRSQLGVGTTIFFALPTSADHDNDRNGERADRR